MGEDEHPRAVRRLDQARLHAPGPGKRRLLVDAASAQGQPDRPGVVSERPQLTDGVGDRGQGLRGNPEDLEQRGVPLGRSELRA